MVTHSNILVSKLVLVLVSISFLAITFISAVHCYASTASAVMWSLSVEAKTQNIARPPATAEQLVIVL